MFLSDAIDAYLRDRRAKGVAPSTVRNDRTTLGQLLAAIGNINTNYIGPRQMDRFWSKYPNWKAGTWNLKRAVLMQFFQWLRQRGHMDRMTDPLEGVKKRRVPKEATNLIPQHEWDLVLQAAENPRDRAIVALGLYLFTRVSEISGMRWRDVDFENKTVAVYRFKTEEYDVLPMCEELEEELRRWRVTYGNMVGEFPHPDWFLIPRYSTPKFTAVSGSTALKMVEPPALLPHKALKGVTAAIKAVLAKVGYDGPNEGGHTLRRSGATALYHELARMGHDRAIRLCQAMLGHKNLATTEIYLSLNLDKKARNDLLAGRRMFQSVGEGVVLELELEALDGEAGAGSVPV